MDVQKQLYWGYLCRNEDLLTCHLDVDTVRECFQSRRLAAAATDVTTLE